MLKKKKKQEKIANGNCAVMVLDDHIRQLATSSNKPLVNICVVNFGFGCTFFFKFFLSLHLYHCFFSVSVSLKSLSLLGCLSLSHSPYLLCFINLSYDFCLSIHSSPYFLFLSSQTSLEL